MILHGKTLRPKEANISSPGGLELGLCLRLTGLIQQNTTTGQLLNNRKLFLTVLEAGESKIKMSEHSGSSESLLPDSHVAIFFAKSSHD